LRGGNDYRSIGAQGGSSTSLRAWPRAAACSAAFFVLDRVDSVLGVLIVLTAMLPVAPGTWAWVLLFGPGTHWLFSLWLYYLDVKARPL